MCFLRISALLFWYADAHAKFAEVSAIKIKQICCNYNKFRFARNSKAISFGVETYGEAALREISCREWFQKFKNDELDIEGKERNGRPKVYEDAELEALLDQDYCQTQEGEYDGQYLE